MQLKNSSRSPLPKFKVVQNFRPRASSWISVPKRAFPARERPLLKLPRTTRSVVGGFCGMACTARPLIGSMATHVLGGTEQERADVSHWLTEKVPEDGHGIAQLTPPRFRLVSG